MTKNEWTTLCLKLLGVYLTIIYGGAFMAQIIAMFAALGKENGAMWRDFYVWQGPVSSLLILMSGIALVWKTDKIATLIWRE